MTSWTKSSLASLTRWLGIGKHSVSIVHDNASKCMFLGDGEDSESGSEYFDADDGFDINVQPSSPLVRPTKLVECIAKRDLEGASQAVNDRNKWILYQKHWYLKKKVQFIISV